ncbi:MAG: DUF202 domain-containing protein [Bacillota bacterium]|nr:DUF202 domain-containing protein [Bacillota bacterium]
MNETKRHLVENRSQDEMAQERTGLSYERTGLAVERTGLAIERTDLAHERTALTNSQTLLAYFRTAIAIVAAGVGMFTFVDNRAIMLVGKSMMGIAPLFVIAGIIHFLVVRKRINRTIVDTKEETEAYEKKFINQ